MQLTSNILAWLGGNVTPEPDDSILQVPNVILPTIVARRPLRGSTTPPLITSPAEDSLQVEVQFDLSGINPAGQTSLGYYQAGVWEFFYSYFCIMTESTRHSALPNAYDPCGITLGIQGSIFYRMLMQATATNLGSAAGANPPIAYHDSQIINMPAIGNLAATYPQLTAAGSSLRLFASVTAHRLS